MDNVMQAEKVEVFAMGRWGRNALDLLRSPRALFQQMDAEGGGWVGPIVYSLLWQYVAAGVGLVVALVKNVPTPLGQWGHGLAFGILPPITVAAGFVFAAFFFLIWHLMGSTRNYATAFRLWALLGPLSVVSAVFRLVPFLTLVVTGYYLYLLVVASVEVHGIKPARAWTVWGSILGALVILMAVGGVVGLARRRGLVRPVGSAGFRPPAIPADIQAQMDKARKEFEKMHPDLADKEKP